MCSWWKICRKETCRFVTYNWSIDTGVIAEDLETARKKEKERNMPWHGAESSGINRC